MEKDQAVKLQCDMRKECVEEVAYIDDHGFVYCQPHGVQRQEWHRCRKLRAYELNRLRRGQQVKSY